MLLAATLVAGSAGLSCASHPLPPAMAAALVEPPPDEQASEAVAGLSVTAEQKKAIDALRTKLHEDLAGATKARDELVKVLLASLTLGRVDHAQVDPAVRALVAATDEAKPAVLAALDTLHALLNPEQRAKLVERLDQRKGESEGESKRRLKQIVQALDLGVSQQIEIASAAKAHFANEKDEVAKLKDQIKAAVTAFKADSFHASELQLARAPLAEHWLGVAISLLEVVVPVLDEEQRLALVAIARKMMGGAADRRPH